MPQDAFTLRYLCLELNETFRGGKINRIVQADADRVMFTVYTGKRTEKLLINVDPSAPRIGVSNEEIPVPLTAPNFCMLLRKHLLSAVITNVELVGFDRIVKITLLSSGEFFDATEKVLYVELMGRYSNIILTEKGKILGGNRGINMFDNGVRPLIVGQPYVFPPVGEKKIPTDKCLVSIFENTAVEQLGSVITSSVQGIAKSTAEEIVRSYCLDAKKCEKIDNGSDFFEYFNDFLYNKKPNPCVVKRDGKVVDVCVYPYGVLDGEKEFFDSLAKAEEYYFVERNKVKIFKQKKERLTSVINTALKKSKKRLSAIRSKQKEALSADENRIKGELLLANIYRLKDGANECELENYYDGSIVKISLDARLSISKNAENYYKKYNKQKRTLSAIAPQLYKAEQEHDYFESVLVEVGLSENVEELTFVQAELESQGVIIEKQINVKIKKQTESFCRVYDIDGFIVKVGRNNTENDKLTFTAKPDDIWLHAKDYHSSHLIIVSEKKQVPEKVINISAEICAYYSKGRDAGKVEIVYTQKKNVKKPSKSNPGFVIYENFKSITVKPNKHDKNLK